MKVLIVKEVKRSDGLWRFACGDVLLIIYCLLIISFFQFFCCFLFIGWGFSTMVSRLFFLDFWWFASFLLVFVYCYFHWMGVLLDNGEPSLFCWFQFVYCLLVFSSSFPVFLFIGWGFLSPTVNCLFFATIFFIFFAKENFSADNTCYVASQNSANICSMSI